MCEFAGFDNIYNKKRFGIDRTAFSRKKIRRLLTLQSLFQQRNLSGVVNQMLNQAVQQNVFRLIGVRPRRVFLFSQCPPTYF